MLAQAIEAEVAEWIDGHAHLTNENGHRQVVRNGHLPGRTITTGVGPVEVKQPRVLDRREDEAEPFSSKILPPYLRKTKSLEELIPWLYLKGVSTGDFGEALCALVGPRADGLSASTVKHAMTGLIADGVLRRVKRGENNKPSLYQIAGVGPPVVVRKATRKPRRVAVVTAPIPVPVSPIRPPDNPLRRVPPGTFATGGFSMIGGRL